MTSTLQLGGVEGSEVRVRYQIIAGAVDLGHGGEESEAQ